MQERPQARSRDVPRQRQGRDARRRLRRARRRRRHLRQRAEPRAAAQSRGAARPQGRRSHAADPRHFRAARADARRQAAGRARAAEVPAAAARRVGGRAVAARRRHRHARALAKRSSKPIAGASAIASASSSKEIDTVRRRRAQLRERRHKRRVPTVALVGYTNAGKTTLFNAADRRRGGGVGRALRHARSARPESPAARSPRAAGVGHGRIHRAAAALARRRVSRDARGGGRRRPAAPRHRRVEPGSRAPHGGRAAGARRGGRGPGAVVDVFNKCDRLDDGRARAAPRALSRRAVRLGADGRGPRRAHRRDGGAARARHRAVSRSSSTRATTAIASGSRSLYRVGRISVTSSPTAACRSRRKCRGGCSIGSGGAWPARRRRRDARRARGSSCAIARGRSRRCVRAKPSRRLPAGRRRRRYPEFVYPAAAAAIARRRPPRAARARLAVAAGGRSAQAAERSFSAVAEAAPGFYPAEAGLGYVALARKDARAARPTSIARWPRTPRMRRRSPDAARRCSRSGSASRRSPASRRRSRPTRS